MQLNIDNSTTNFGRIKIDLMADNFIRRSLSEADFNKFQQLAKQESSNLVDVYLTSDGKRMRGYIAGDNYSRHPRYKRQRIIFDSPIKFIERLVKKAEVKRKEGMYLSIPDSKSGHL